MLPSGGGGVYSRGSSRVGGCFLVEEVGLIPEDLTFSSRGVLPSGGGMWYSEFQQDDRGVDSSSRVGRYMFNNIMEYKRR